MPKWNVMRAVLPMQVWYERAADCSRSSMICSSGLNAVLNACSKSTAWEAALSLRLEDLNPHGVREFGGEGGGFGSIGIPFFWEATMLLSF